MSRKQDIIRKKKKIIITSLSILLILLVTIATILIVKLNSTKEIVSNAKSNDNKANVEENPIIVDVSEEPEEPEQNSQAENPEQEKPNEQNNESKTTISQNPKYYIKVNYKANTVTIYTKDSNGNYTVPYKAMLCSTGKATPKSGVYTIPGGKWDRYIWGQMVGGVWAQYYTRIKGSILFHSVPYTAKNKGTLEYWEYDKLGTTASAGCIRLTVQDAKWIYDNCSAGTKVEFYADSNPGPLGKPTAQKISSEEAVRGWDPTDVSKDNPWQTYTPKKKGENNVQNNNVVENNDDRNNNENTSNNTADDNQTTVDSTKPSNNNQNEQKEDPEKNKIPDEVTGE